MVEDYHPIWISDLYIRKKEISSGSLLLSSHNLSTGLAFNKPVKINTRTRQPDPTPEEREKYFSDARKFAMTIVDILADSDG